jgi:organic hydroperoxide reductase OsmC/OhrA
MSHHRARVAWERSGRPFTYDEYSREHAITYGGGASMKASAAAEFRGNAALPNPEELLVAALANCHMLTFLAIAARKGIVVEKYEDSAEGTLATNAEGRMSVIVCELRPKVTFGSGATVDGETLRDLHHQSHLGCFIAASVKTAVTVELPDGTILH